ncbi:MAG: PEGA domain-containing protein [Pseudolabrys sp.]
MMYRVIAIIGGGLMLAACSSSGSNFELFKSSPSTDAVRFESEPPGADVKVGDLTCRTPCSLAIPTSGPQTATFALNGYQTATEQLDVQTTSYPPTFSPKPVTVELAVAPPPAPRRATTRKRPAKPAAKPRAAAPAAAPAAAAPAPAAAAPAGTAPWPTAPAPARQ